MSAPERLKRSPTEGLHISVPKRDTMTQVGLPIERL
eukprot:COSAG01_NODE_56633_length_317_cov_0.701835_1_plen_35_part_10